MCGIVGFTGADNAAPKILEGLEKLEYRGYDSAGIAVLNNGVINITKVTGRIAVLKEKTKGGATMPGTTAIGHTRWATHGAPTDTNAHPHLSNDGRFAIVHNGIIENYMELKEALISNGYTFESETDTEVVVHLLEKYYNGDMHSCIRKIASKLKGSYALGILCTENPNTVFVTKQSSPLILGIGVGENYFASDVTALISHTQNVIYLEDGEFAEITPDEIKVFDCIGNKIKKTVSMVNWDIQAAEKGGYEHFMLKEIMEQPRAVKSTLTPRIKDGKITLDNIDLKLDNIQKILITACGSAYYAGCAGKYIIEKLCRIPVEPQLASELRYSDPIIDEHTLVIIISQSGETADTIAAMKECSKRGAKTLAIVNVVGSAIAKLADYTLYTHAGPEIAVATTKGYTTQLTVLYLFAVYAAGVLNKITPDEYSSLLNDLMSIPKLLQDAIDINSRIENTAKKYCSSGSMFFIGRNTDYALALEGALKMKEISYLHAECYAAGELKHGTIALISEGTPVIALACNQDIKEKTMSNIVEVKSRGAKVLAVSISDDKNIATLANDIITVPKFDSPFAPILEIIPLQLLAYHVAKLNGCDIDKPKNLAKSVTVE
jgi:glucosamine--fructose-6-phosphate aminotransferase (isomerizing)